MLSVLLLKSSKCGYENMQKYPLSVGIQLWCSGNSVTCEGSLITSLQYFAWSPVSPNLEEGRSNSEGLKALMGENGGGEFMSV